MMKSLVTLLLLLTSVAANPGQPGNPGQGGGPPANSPSDSSDSFDAKLGDDSSDEDTASVTFDDADTHAGLSAKLEELKQHANTAGQNCDFPTIVWLCGDIRLHSIDDAVYGFHPLVNWRVNVMSKLENLHDRMQNNPNWQFDHPDVAMSYAFMHYLCFDPLIAPQEEHKIFECMKHVCPHMDGVEDYCEGMNT